MNITLVAAAGLAVLVGSVHSVMGERRLFRSGTDLPPRYRGILRATWHATTLFGLALVAIMLSDGIAGRTLAGPTRLAVTVSMALAASAVFVWTRGRHPGWIGLGLVAILAALS